MDRSGPKHIGSRSGSEAHQCDPLRIHSGFSARRRSTPSEVGPKWAVGGGPKWARSGPGLCHIITNAYPILTEGFSPTIVNELSSPTCIDVVPFLLFSI